MGEGSALFILKRLTDAERDGDKIYAVFRGIGASSDGKGKGITAPNPAGQKLALERAWDFVPRGRDELVHRPRELRSAPGGHPHRLRPVRGMEVVDVDPIGGYRPCGGERAEVVEDRRQSARTGQPGDEEVETSRLDRKPIVECIERTRLADRPDERRDICRRPEVQPTRIEAP
jgi:hypothetical protein